MAGYFEDQSIRIEAAANGFIVYDGGEKYVFEVLEDALEYIKSQYEE